MKITELHARITTIMKVIELHFENYETHENSKVPCENQENNEIHIIP